VGVRRFSVPVRRLERSHNGFVVATVPAYRELAGFRLAAGRFFKEQDDAQLQNVVVLGAEMAERLFPRADPIGEVVQIDRFFYTVIGVLREQDRPDGTLTAALVDRGVYMPLRTCKVRFGERVILREAGTWRAEAVQLHELLVTARAPAQVPLLVEGIKTILEQSHAHKDWEVRAAAASR
jgi:putative ABC transport system permease protein